MKGVIIMMVNTNNLVSLTEANRNFSKVARLVDERGSAVILKNNAPRYLVIDFAQAERVQEAADDDIMRISSRLIAQNRVHIFAFLPAVTHSGKQATGKQSRLRLPETVFIPLLLRFRKIRVLRQLNF